MQIFVSSHAIKKFVTTNHIPPLPQESLSKEEISVYLSSLPNNESVVELS